MEMENRTTNVEKKKNIREEKKQNKQGLEEEKGEEFERREDHGEARLDRKDHLLFGHLVEAEFGKNCKGNSK